MLDKGSKRRRRNSQDATGTATDRVGADQNVDPAARSQTAMQLVMELMQEKDQMSLGDLLSEANSAATDADSFTRAELESALISLDGDNKIMFYDGMVHKV